MNSLDARLLTELNQRKRNNSLRTLTPKKPLVDFCSNDYLGLARSALLHKTIASIKTNPISCGSTGSRLISGHSSYIEELERNIAQFHQAEAALLFNSGYDANLGIMSCLPKRNDTILYDQLIHASLRDGIRLSHAKSYGFAHNNLARLEQLLQKATGQVFVVVESIYSMDGDTCPLEEMVSLTQQYQAALIVDEAHATGVFGHLGEGLVVEKQLQDRVFARVHTFGKALGVHGGVVVGSSILIDYLINYARSFIYTTALPNHSYQSIASSYAIFPTMKNERVRLRELIALFQSALSAELNMLYLPSDSPIQCICIPGNDNVKQLAYLLQTNGYDVRAILSPTVPQGKERLRICLHAFNTKEEIIALVKSLTDACKIVGCFLDSSIFPVSSPIR